MVTATRSLPKHQRKPKQLRRVSQPQLALVRHSTRFVQREQSQRLQLRLVALRSTKFERQRVEQNLLQPAVLHSTRFERRVQVLRQRLLSRLRNQQRLLLRRPHQFLQSHRHLRPPPEVRRSIAFEQWARRRRNEPNEHWCVSIALGAVSVQSFSWAAPIESDQLTQQSPTAFSNRASIIDRRRESGLWRSGDPCLETSQPRALWLLAFMDLGRSWG